MSTFERRNYSDQLNIETPEQVELQFRVAGIGSRFVAVMLDHILQAVAFFFLILIFVLVAAGAYKSFAGLSGITYNTTSKWALAALIFISFCLNWGYFALFEAFWKGQTPGKRVMKLRAIKDSGRQITLFESLARNLLRYVDYLPSMYLIGVITMLCNKSNKRLGDYAAGTIVIHEARDEQPLFYQGYLDTPFPPQPKFATAPQTSSGVFPADAVAKLSASDLQIIDTFFARALDLNVETRASMATRIATTMTTRMGVPLPESNPERVLEAIAMQMRGSGRRF